MITQTDIEKYKKWLAKLRKHGECIYEYISDPFERANKCRSIFPNLKKNRHKKCKLVCPCDQYGTRYIMSVVRNLVDAGQTNK